MATGPTYNRPRPVGTKYQEGSAITSDKQIDANRRNARKSTGPKTSEGKARASRNATRHGLLSEDILLSSEDVEDLEELSELLWDELQPVGELENHLVERIIAARWRLYRLGRVEAGIFDWEISEAQREASEYVGSGFNSTNVIGKLGLTFIRDSDGANAFSKLARYETTIERSLYRALHELQRLQAARRAEGSATPPAALEVDISGISGE